MKPVKPKGFEQSKFDKDTKRAPEGTKADMARDKKQMQQMKAAKRGKK